MRTEERVPSESPHETQVSSLLTSARLHEELFTSESPRRETQVSSLLTSARLHEFNAGEYGVPRVSTNQRKSREPGVYFRTRYAGHRGRYEPRFKPPRETLSSGKSLIHDHLPLGGYDTLEEAKIVHQIAAFYYGKAESHLDLGDGRHFAIDSSWNEQLDLRRGKDKRKWVASKAKEVFEEFKKAKDSSGLLNASKNHVSVISSGAQTANARDSSQSVFSSPAVYKSPEKLAPSSRTALPIAFNPDKQWFAESVLDEGDGAVNKEFSADIEYFPVSSPLPLTQDFIEPTSTSLRLPENPEVLGASLQDFTDEQLDEKNEYWLDDFVMSLPDSGLIANGHPQCSVVNATANERRASLFEPDGPCSLVEGATTQRENQGTEGSYVEAAIPDKISLDITTVPVEGALLDSQDLQSPQDGMDVGAPLSDPRFDSELSKEDWHLFSLMTFYRQECENYKRKVSELERENCERRRIFEKQRENDKGRIFELEREVKRLKGKSPDLMPNTSQPCY